MARNTARIVPRLAAACLALAASALLAGCATQPPPREEPPPLPEPSAEAIRMAAVGDSITDGDSIDLAGGTPGPQSWVSYAIGPGVEFVGGWAEWGATTEQMAAGVRGPLDADVLVLLAGTNDAGRLSHDRIGEHLERIAEQAAVDAVVLSSVPPTDFAGENKAELNEYLERLAERQDWTWVDAASGLRDGDDGAAGFAEGMSYDGVHPTEEGARVLGEAIAPAVLRAASR